VIPIVTPAEMAGVDRAATDPVGLLVGRAGFGVARAAALMLGRSYGKRVVVVAGRGNNGADGRAAAALLTRRGVSVKVLEATSLDGGATLPDADLVIDAAYGTGLSRAYSAPDPGRARVLAVDIPSGLSGITGQPVGDPEPGHAVRADRTVTFAALKPGLLLGGGPDLAGLVEVVDIGLGHLVDDVAQAWLVTDDDVIGRLPARRRESHKWMTAVGVVGGSPGMPGAPILSTHGAMRAGAGYAIVAVPGSPPGGGLPPGEYVGRSLPGSDWGAAAAESVGRARAVVIGPGLGDCALGPAGETGLSTPVARFLAAAPLPAVVDADGLNALGDLSSLAKLAADRSPPTVITPHEGEFARLVGRPPAEDRITDVRRVASETGAVVLLKGSTTVVAGPDGRVLVVNAGSSRLATAGTGDVLSGIIAAFLARGLPGLEGAALAAHCHGRAAALGPSEGLVASDLPGLTSRWLSEARG
jgi:ADP-dependent NAD(P)H-hydrate dehydratase / NAD(P)H-hydrate epimerase